MNKEQMLAVLDSLEWGFEPRRCPICCGETDHKHTKDCPFPQARAAIVALYEENERLRSAGQETIEMMGDIWETKNADDDFIYDEMGPQLSGAYFQLRAAIAAGSAQ
jgi:hypothetical protein